MGFLSGAKKLYDATVGVGDHLSGNVDEAVGSAKQGISQGDIGQVGDAISGNFDEVTGQAVTGITQGDYAAVGDALSGNVDEAIGRVSSGEESVWDAAAGTTDEATRKIKVNSAKFFDTFAGSTDETVGRTFDSKAGGGLGDMDTWVPNFLPGWVKYGIVAVIGVILLYLVRPLLGLANSATN